MSGVSSLPASLKFEAYRNKTFMSAFTVTEDSLPYDLSAASVIMYLRDTKTGDPIVTLTEGSGITVSTNVISVVITPSQLTTWEDGGTAFYELQVNEGSDITTWIAGVINISN
jgi:hypothetical protein